MVLAPDVGGIPGTLAESCGARRVMVIDEISRCRMGNESVERVRRMTCKSASYLARGLKHSRKAQESNTSYEKYE